MPRVFYRVTRSNPPTLQDFSSNFLIGRTLANPTPERVRLWKGISVFETEEQAREKAKAVPQVGRFIARIDFTNAPQIIAEPTLGAGHYTVWGAPDELLRCWAPPVSDV